MVLPADIATDKVSDAFEEMANDVGDSLDGITSGMDNLTNGLFDLAGSITGIDFGSIFGDELTGTIKDGLSGILGEIGLGDFADKLGGEMGAGIISGASDALNAALSGGSFRDNFADIGAGVADAIGAYVGIPGLGQIAKPILDDLSQIGTSSEATAKGLFSAIFPADALFGGFLGDAFAGLFENNGDAAAQARKSIEGFLEDVTGENFVFGDRGRFETPGWAAGWWESMEATSVQAFDALGVGLTHILGVTEDVGTQIGFILSENLNGNLDSARDLMSQLGISAEQLEEAIIQQGVAAGDSWHTIEVMLQGVSQLAGEGLAGIGDLEGAFGRLIISGGKGMEAVNALRNVAIEAMEAGATTLEELEAKLLQTGKFTDGEITALMEGLRQRGITSLDALGDAGVRILGGVIADMLTALGEDFSKSQGEIEALIDSIESIPRNIRTTHTIVTNHVNNGGGGGGGANGGTAARGSAFAFANGGVVNSPTFFNFENGTKKGIMGEAGPEGILPLAKVNGKLGVSAAGMQSPTVNEMHFHVSAPNSQLGVVEGLESMMREMIDAAAYKTLEIIAQERIR